MAVSKNDSGTAFKACTFNTLPTSLSLTTFTVGATGSNKLLIGMLQTSTSSNNGTITGSAITWNGVSMTSVGVANNTSGGRVEIFILINPATGNQTMAASWTGGADATLGAISFDNADQTTGIVAGDTQQITGTAASPDNAVTSSTDGATVAAFTAASSVTTGGADPQTNIWVDDSNWVNCLGSYALGGTSNNHSINTSSSAYSMVGIHIKAYSAPAVFQKQVSNTFRLSGPGGLVS